MMVFQLLLLSFASSAVALRVAPAAQEGTKVSVPDLASQKAAEKQVREVFGEEYTKPGKLTKRALAEKLLKQGTETEESSALTFVLLREARDLASQAGDFTTAMRAVDEMAKRFAVNSLKLKLSGLDAASKLESDPEGFKGIARTYLSLGEEALRAEDMDSADLAAKSAAAAARRAKEMSLVTASSEQSKRVAALGAKLKKVEAARLALAKDPNHAESNWVVGEHLCKGKGDWTAGLPLLAKGSDAGLRALAERDLANPSAAGDQEALGDGWWDLAEKERGDARQVLRERAAHWYSLAVAGLQGLKRAKIELRLGQVQRSKLLGPDHLWTPVTDPAIFGRTGKKDGVVALGGRPRETDMATYMGPAGVHDAISFRISFNPATPAQSGVIFGERKFTAYVDAISSVFIVGRLRGTDTSYSWERTYEMPCEKKAEYVITLILPGDELVVLLDDQEMKRLKAESRSLGVIKLHSSEGPAKFDQIRLRERR